MKMPWESVIDGVTGLISEAITDPDKKAEIAYKTIEVMLQNKTVKFVDAVVKLAFASEQIIKGLVRPVFSLGIFAYALYDPDILTKLHALGAVGDMGIATIFGSAPAWGYSRHKSKMKSKQQEDWDVED